MVAREVEPSDRSMSQLPGLLSPSRLRSMEHEQEQRQGETAKCIDE
jgi:hypothetical protein